MKGDKITNVDQLLILANHKRAVMTIKGRFAAAFVIGMPLKTVIDLLNKGMYIYEPNLTKPK